MSLDALEQYLWWLAIAGHLTLALLMWRYRLHHKYRLFFYYLCFRVGRSLLLAVTPLFVQPARNQPSAPFGNDPYALAWMLTEPVMWFFYIVVVLELYSLVLQKYRGIATLSRWVLLAGLLAAVLVSALTLWPDLRNQAEQFPILRLMLTIQRGVVSSLVFFLLFITGFLVWYPVPLSRNVVVHCVAYATYFLSNAMLVLVRNLTGNEVTQTVNILLSCVTVIALVLWIALLNPRGEVRTVLVRQQWAGGEEERLVEQLAAINSTLLRTARKE